MTLFAIDPGTRTGWAYRSVHKSVDGDIVTRDAGMVTFEPKRGTSAGMKFILFTEWLKTTLDTIEPRVVAYEMAHHRGGASTELLVGFTTRIQEACERRGVEYIGVHTATLKKAVLGSGRADKSASIKFACDYLGRGVTDDNEGDAVCLLAYLEKMVGGKDETPTAR